MKKFYSLLTLIALLLVSVLLLAACDKKNDNPATDTTDETTAATDTTGETTAATTPDEKDTAESDVATEIDTVADTAVESESETPTESAAETMDGAAYLDRILAAEAPTGDNYKIVVDENTILHMNVNGNEMDLPMSADSTEIVDGDHLHLIGTSEDDPYEIIYLDGILYYNFMGELLKCPATPEQVSEITSLLSGVEWEEDDSADTGELFPGLKSADIFTSITAEKKADGSTVVVAKGFNKAMLDKMAPEMQEFFYAMGMIGGNLTDDDYASMTEEMLDNYLNAEIVKLLSGMSDDAMVVTFTTDSEDNIISANVKLTLSATFDYEGAEVKYDLSMDSTTYYIFGGQKVTAPANAAEYIEGTWDEFFGTLSPEDYGLVPDETGVITLSDDPTWRALQIAYMTEMPDLFVENVFLVSGLLDIYEMEDGSPLLTVYLLDENGEPDLDSSIDALFAEGLEAELIAKIDPSAASFAVIGNLVVLDISGEPYPVLILYDLASFAAN